MIRNKAQLAGNGYSPFQELQRRCRPNHELPQGRLIKVLWILCYCLITHGFCRIVWDIRHSVSADSYVQFICSSTLIL